MPTHTYMKAEGPRTTRPAVVDVQAAPSLREKILTPATGKARYLEYALYAAVALAGAWFVFELVRYLNP